MLKFIVINALLVLWGWIASAQIEKSVVIKHSLKTVVGSANTYILNYEVTILPNYYVYSSIPPEKDANLPTEHELITKSFIADGPFTEQGDLIIEYDKIFETDVRYFKKSVVFQQKITKIGNETILKTKLKFQVCDKDGKCVLLTPEFKFKLPEHEE